MNCYKTAVLLLSLILTACGGGGADGPVSQSGTNTFTGQPLSCGRFDKTQVGDYVASPQAWSNSLPAGYQDCVGINSTANGVQFDSKWNMPTSISGSIYPEIIYGLKAGTTSANSTLPKSISSTNSLLVSWNYELTNAGSSGNVLLESWLTNTPTPSGLAPYQGTLVELAILLEYFGDRSVNYSLPIVTVGGNQYYLSADNGPGAPSTAYGTIQSGHAPYQYRVYFSPVNPIGRNASLDIKLFAQYLIDNNYIPANTLYFSDIEFGAEISFGPGELKMTNYSVTVN